MGRYINNMQSLTGLVLLQKLLSFDQIVTKLKCSETVTELKD